MKAYEVRIAMRSFASLLSLNLMNPIPFSFRHGRWFASGPGFVCAFGSRAECERFAQAKGMSAVFVS